MNNQKGYLSKLIPHLPCLGLILASTFFAYWGLQNSYFEQDEWHSFGNYNYLLSLKGTEFWGNLLVSDFPYHFAPLSLIFKMTVYRIFSLNAAPYFIVSIFIHFLVSVSLYALIFILTKRRLVALMGALFFAVNSSHYQAVTWVGTFEGVEFSILFGIMSLYSYLLYLQRKQLKFLILTSVFLLIGLLFKETALTFFMLLGLLALLGQTIRLKIISILSLVLVLVLYISLRFTYLLFGVQVTAVSVLSGGAEGDFALVFIYNSFVSFVKLFTQIFLPNELLVYISNVTSSPFDIYPYFARGPWVIENGFRYDLLTLPLGIILMVLLWVFGRKVEDRKGIFWGLGIMIFTLVPLLALSKYLTFLDSRYIYPASVGFSLIVGVLSTRIFLLKNKLVIGLGLVALFLVMSFHIFLLKETISKLVNTGQMRKPIVSSIVSSYPRLPAKAIFYTSSNSPFYGSAENERIMPFQSGFGQLLLTSYHPVEHFPAEFFKNDFLWNLTDQGYKEVDGRGFGYFWDFDLMAETIKSKNLPQDAIISFKFDSESGNLVDTTNQIRQRLISVIADKEEINVREFSTNSNKTNLNLIFDKDLSTFWDSTMPIIVDQELVVDLGIIKRIAQLGINSTSSKDQNRNGYQILTSEDGESWQEVYYEKLYPPKDGVTKIYISPTRARFIKIKQIGDHQYVNWIINEIQIYQVKANNET